MARNKKKVTKTGRVTPTRASPTSRKKKEQKKSTENKKISEHFTAKTNDTKKTPWQMKDPPQGDNGEYEDYRRMDDDMEGPIDEEVSGRPPYLPIRRIDNSEADVQEKRSNQEKEEELSLIHI